MWIVSAKIVGALLLISMLFGVVFFVGMRQKFRPVLTAVRRTNRATFNRHAMKTAGTPGAWASVIRHVGRKTGDVHQTPVQAVASDDGFVIALPYGTQSDWLKNVLASGSATIINEGETYRVVHPEIVPASLVARYFPAKDQRSHRLFHLEHCLRVQRAGDDKQASVESRIDANVTM